jgi:hypothetical protein
MGRSKISVFMLLGLVLVMGTVLGITSIDSLDDDSIPVLDEVQHGSNPFIADTDGDGLNDRIEIREYQTDPASADTDIDGLDDGSEINKFGTNPFVADTDGDGLEDGDEVHNQALENADPARMDVFVEIDYMSGSKPSNIVFDSVQEAYADAPIKNPDGSTGIELHLILDEQVPVERTTNPVDTDRIMKKYFDHENEGWHYAVAVRDARVRGGDWFGYSEYRRDNGQITFQTTHINSQESWSSKDTAAIFMHELGHSVGIGVETYRGVDSEEIPFAQYSSIMNYNAPPQTIQYNDGEPFDDWAYIKENIYTPHVRSECIRRLRNLKACD